MCDIFQILTNIIEDLLDLDCPTNPKDCLELIEKTLRNNPNDRLYLLIHNIDGIMLRSNKAQNALASLAAVSNIHVIASVDHINAPLRKFYFYFFIFNFMCTHTQKIFDVINFFQFGIT